MDPDKRKAFAALVICEAMKPKKRKKSFWAKEWYKNRDTYSHITLLKELKENNPDDYKNYLRMSDDVFQDLLVAVTPFIEKKDTVITSARGKNTTDPARCQTHTER